VELIQGMAGIYIHIPFCRQACHYCDFHFATSLKDAERMIECMVLEMKQRSDEIGSAEIETIYLGGGTPSILEPKHYDQLFQTIHQCFSLSNDLEITLEANPEDLNAERLSHFKSLGINRLSIGVQSFRDEDLKWMNRAHSAEEARAAIELALQFGFKDLNLDLIYGIPNMTQRAWQKNVDEALLIGVNHISAYNLTVESGTALAHFVKKGTSKDVDEEQSIAELNYLKQACAQHGWERYEISNYCKAGNYAKHNTNYWRSISYFGFGPSAHSFNATEQTRRWNVRNNAKYMKNVENGSLYFEMEKLSIRNQFNELLMLGLRTKWGVDIREVQERISEFSDAEAVAASFHQSIQDLEVKGWMQRHGASHFLTEVGKNYADAALAELFLEETS
jgi:oxygen-independent coproporphyrinogen-3 oxidase